MLHLSSGPGDSPPLQDFTKLYENLWSTPKELHIGIMGYPTNEGPNNLNDCNKKNLDIITVPEVTERLKRLRADSGRGLDSLGKASLTHKFSAQALAIRMTLATAELKGRVCCSLGTRLSIRDLIYNKS